MKNEHEFHVVDAKQVFLKWNSLQLENIQNIVLQDASKYIHLIPFFLQINHKILPGFVGMDTPAGVYSYVPDKKIIDDIVDLNSKFRYQPEGVVKKYAIEAIYIQNSVVSENNKCWLIIAPELTEKKQQELNDKVEKIKKWFASKHLNITFIVLTLNEFNDNKCFELTDEKKSLHLDKFYSESILLAGKYPVWWLVPPENEKEYDKFVEYIRQARFVDNEEFIDFGRLDHYDSHDMIKSSVEVIKKMNQSPEICLVELLLLDQKKIMYPEIEGVSIRIKKTLYANDFNINSVQATASIMHDTLARYEDKKHILSPVKLFLIMQSMSIELSSKLLIVFLDGNDGHINIGFGVDGIIMKLKFFKSISFEIRQLFEHIVAFSNNESVPAIDNDLRMIVDNMLSFLSDGESKVSIYNNKSNDETIFSRIHLKQKKIKNISYWDLILDSEEEQKKIEGFNCLLGLLSWCWLNNVVNQSTQVSINSCDKQVKQVEAYSIMETLIQKLNPRKISNIPVENYNKPAVPLCSLLFISFVKNNVNNSATEDFLMPSKTPNLYCEQLIVDSWGGAYTKIYSGEAEVLKCLCDWTHVGSPEKSVWMPEFNIFGHGVGDSFSMAQRIEQIFEDLKQFFYREKVINGRFIVKLTSVYYLIEANKKLLPLISIGTQRELTAFLECPLSEFKPTWVDSLSLSEYPLHEMFLRNKVSVVQVYFQVANKSCYVWVIDEKGSLWSDVLTVYNRDSFLMHWLYLFKNIRLFLKRTHDKNYVLPSLEINHMTTNKLGKLEFHSVGAEAITGSKNFIDIKVNVLQQKGEDQLNIYCDEHEFLYRHDKNNVFSSCVKYLLERIKKEGRTSVFVTDINVPLDAFNVKKLGDIQVSHLLKIKRSFEHRINKSLGG